MTHGGMMHLREHESDAGFCDAAGDDLGTDIELDAECGQIVGRTRFRTQRPVSVFGDGNTGAGDDQRRQRRDIVGAAGVAAGADDVDRIGRSIDGQHFRAHRGDGADDLIDGFAAHAQRHQEATDLRGRRLARHQDVEGGSSLLTRQRLAACGLGQERLQIGHKAS